jgi:hypothetical protein
MLSRTEPGSGRENKSVGDKNGTVMVENSTANNNVAYGFDATPNATSGRHNTARGNGTTNCVNVSCTS